MKSFRLGSLASVALFVVIAAACTPPMASPRPATQPPHTTSAPTYPTGSSPTPVASPAPTPRASDTAASVTSAAHAAALVFASDERWARMSPLRSDMIGQSTWYEAAADGAGFAVNITVGQGDCFAGCIEQHTWFYRVDAAGTVELVRDEGEDVQVEEPAGGDGPARLTIQLAAGPTCPVEQDPPDPNCQPRAVESAEVVVFDHTGREVARELTDDDGMTSVDLPGGAYFVVPAAVDGLMGTPEPQAFAFMGGHHVDLLFTYDTGIR